MNIFKIVFIGPQGSGKGTQAFFLSKKFHLPIISTGDLFRNEAKKDTERGKELYLFLTKGQLITDTLTCELVREKFREIENAGYILDGFPRNYVQAEFLLSFTTPTHIFVLEISDEESIRRIEERYICTKCATVYHSRFDPPVKDFECDHCGGKLKKRSDDTKEALIKRLKIYHKETEPILSVFKEKGFQIIFINGDKTIEEVRKEIEAVFC